MRSTTHQLQVERRERHRDNQVYALTHTPAQVEKRERDIEPIKCMLSPHPATGGEEERDIETIKCMRSPHTSYRWRRERDIEPIKCMRTPHTSYRWIESWFVPHHLVKHNGKNRLVFNCSYTFKGESLNAHLIPGPTLGSSFY